MSGETTPAIKAAARSLDASHGWMTGEPSRAAVGDARLALTGAVGTECHESVPYEWADGDEGPCNASDVVGYRLDEGHPYPVCAEHMRAPMVPLHVAFLGDAEWLRDASQATS